MQCALLCTGPSDVTLSCSLSAPAHGCSGGLTALQGTETSEVLQHALCFSVFPFISVIPVFHTCTVSLETTEAGPVFLKERKMDQFGCFLSFSPIKMLLGSIFLHWLELLSKIGHKKRVCACFGFTSHTVGSLLQPPPSLS